MVSHSAREVERLKKQGVDIKEKRPDDGFYEWTNPDTGEVLKIPNGIDPGWAYNPGKTAWGRHISRKAMDAWRSQGARAWEGLTPGDWQTHGRPEKIHVDQPKAKVGPRLRSKPAMLEALKKVLGGEDRVFSFKSGKFRYDVLANAETLAEHIPLDRSPFVPFIREAMEEPFEVWLSFERHRGTGKVVLRQRIIKAVRLDKDRAILIVAQSKNGVMEAWTVIPTSDLRYVNGQRKGRLIWARK